MIVSRLFFEWSSLGLPPNDVWTNSESILLAGTSECVRVSNLPLWSVVVSCLDWITGLAAAVIQPVFIVTLQVILDLSARRSDHFHRKEQNPTKYAYLLRDVSYLPSRFSHFWSRARDSICHFVGPSVGPSVGWSVRQSVGHTVGFSMFY